jgi:CARDB protein
MAGRGDLGVLQAVGIPLPGPRQRGPSPGGINVIDVGGAPPPSPAPAPPPPPTIYPDLVVSSVYGDESTAENLCDIFAEVRNAGSADAPATITRFLSTEPDQFDQLVATPALGAGQTATVRLDRQYGQYNGASVTADATSVVAESDEANNTTSGFGTPNTNGRCRYP